MPTYCFQNEKSGLIIERFFSIGKAPREIVEAERKYLRSFAAEAVGVPPTKGWPIECLSSGVAPQQAGELREHFKKAGIKVDVTPSGNPVYLNKAHKDRALKSRGLHDKS